MSTRILSTLAFLTGVATAQPMITGGPVNAASYVMAGLPNANIAQGSMFILFGQNLGPSTQANANSFPLPTNLGGTSISATVGGTAVDAIMLYSTSTQVAAILPSNTPIGAGTLTLTFNSKASNTVGIHVVASTLGIFTRNQSGSGPGVFFNFNSQTDQPVNSLVTAAHPGQVLTLWGTGLGAVSGKEADGPLPGNLSVPVTVYVGTKAVTPTYEGRSGCCAGIDQVVFTVPDGVEGCHVSVNVQAGGVVSNSTTIAVAPSGSICSDSAGFSAMDLQKVAGGKALTVGEIELVRVSAKLSLPGGNEDGNIDFAQGRFRQYLSAQDFLASRNGSVGALRGFPSVGSCVVSPFNYKGFTDPVGFVFGGAGDPVNLTDLDAGPALTITGPNGAVQLPQVNVSSPQFPDYRYRTQGQIGGGLQGLTNSILPDYLSAGSYTGDDGSGGAQIGKFSAMLDIPANPPEWTNENSLSNISRSKDLTVTWSGGVAGGIQAIAGGSADPLIGAGAIFVCLSPADAGTFTLPEWLLSALPASGTDPLVNAPVGFLMLGAMLPQPSRFSASGIDVGFFNWLELQTRNVNFQ